MISFSDQSLLIVGGGSGIGLSAAQEAVRLGAHVTVADADSGASAAVRQLGPLAEFVTADATDALSTSAAVGHAARRVGRLDGVLTTVGGAQVLSVEQMDLGTWHNELDFNLTSAFVVLRAALEVMRTQGSGAIVTTSSGYSTLPGPDRAAYAAAKSGVEALTRSTALAVAGDGVRVNCIAPGPTDTPRFRSMNGGPAGVEQVRKRMPLGRIPQPRDVARVALFLLSDAAREMTGQVLHVNGGLLMA